jgi:hypothetical protein
MRLKLLFRGDKALLATEHGEIIENASILHSYFIDDAEYIYCKNNEDIAGNNVIVKPQLILQIKFDGIIETMPTDVDGSVVEAEQQALIEAKGNEVKQ